MPATEVFVHRNAGQGAVGLGSGRYSADEQAPIRGQPLASKEGAVIGGQEERRGCHLARVAEATHWRGRDLRSPNPWRHPLNQRRVDPAWTDGVHADAARCHFLRQSASERKNATLGGGIGHKGNAATQRCDARHVDDHAVVPAAHQLERFARTKEKPIQMNGDHAEPTCRPLRPRGTLRLLLPSTSPKTLAFNLG
jgi:hypothetical protein